MPKFIFLTAIKNGAQGAVILKLRLPEFKHSLLVVVHQDLEDQWDYP